MSWPFALMIEPVPADSPPTDFSSTFSVREAAAPALSVGEISTQRGDGIFETIGVIDGHAQEVGAHLERLQHSARLCDLPLPNVEQWRQAVHRAAQACPAGESVIRLMLSRAVGGSPAATAWVTATPASDFSAVRAQGVRAVTLDRGYDLTAGERAPWLLLGAKTLSYAVNMAALREAHRRGADDAIFVTRDGFVLEAPTASLIVRSGDRFLTPAASGGILQGTTQLSVFDYLSGVGHAVGSDVMTVAQVRECRAAWLVSSVRLAVPVTALDDTALPVDAALTRELNAYLLSPRD